MSFELNEITGRIEKHLDIVTGNHKVLRDPVSAQAAIDTIETNYRPFRYNSSLGTNFYISTTGSDTTGDGSISNPVLTIDRALQFIGVNQPSNINLNFSAGTFTLPTIISNLYNVSFLGTVSTDATDINLSVASITTQSNDNQLVFTITRGTPLTNDQWKGKMLSVSSGGTLSRIWCYRNVANTLYCVTNVSISTPQLTTSSKISLLSLDTNLQYITGSNTLTNCSVVQFTGCQITGTALGRIPFFVATDKIQFNDCYFAVNRPQIGQAGGAFIFRSYIASIGDSVEGVLSIVRGGNLRIGQGSVISGDSASLANRFVRASQDCKVSFDGPLIMRNMGGFKVEGGAIFTEGGVDPLDVIHFENGSGTTSNTAAFLINLQGEGSGGTQSLPKLTGAITGAYSVSSTNDSFCRYTSTSTLTTSLGTNTVSANAGVSLSAQSSDGTSIKGATPSYSSEFNTQVDTNFASSPHTVVMETTKLIVSNTIAGNVIELLPKANSVTKGATITFKNLNNGSANFINVTPDATLPDTIDLVAGVYAVAVGVKLTLASDGVNNWNII